MCSLFSLWLWLALPPAVTFVTQDVVPHGPALRPLHPGVKHLVTVLQWTFQSLLSFTMYWTQKLRFTSHLKHCGWKSLSRALILGAFVCPSLGTMGLLHTEHLNANILKNKRFEFWVSSSIPSEQWLTLCSTRGSTACSYHLCWRICSEGFYHSSNKIVYYQPGL